MNRREFLTKASALTLGLLATPSLLANKRIHSNLVSDSNNIIDLPLGFNYKVISQENDIMSDGLLVPHSADGMACFEGNKNRIILIRNHEIGHIPNIENFLTSNPYGKAFQKYLTKNWADFYDSKLDKTQCYGGTTSIVYNVLTEKVESQYLSLCGTLVNCSGGPTPWGTWISCEETTKIKVAGLYQSHGYPFEVVPSSEIKLLCHTKRFSIESSASRSL